MVEVVVGGALVLCAGLALSISKSETTKMDSRLDLNVLMRRALDRAALEVVRNGGLFVPQPLEANGVYYGCYGKNGVMVKNDEGTHDFGFKSMNITKSDKEGLFTGRLDSTWFRDNKLGVDYSASGGITGPCSDHHFAMFILPLEESYDAYIWAYGLKSRRSSTKDALPTLVDRITLSLVF